MCGGLDNGIDIITFAMINFDNPELLDIFRCFSDISVEHKEIEPVGMDIEGVEEMIIIDCCAWFAINPMQLSCRRD
jgi:hypothetical protein